MEGTNLKSEYSYQKLIDESEDASYDDEKSKEHVALSGFACVSPSPWHVIRIPFRHFIRVIIALPLGAFIFCVFWALYTDNNRATTVLCTREHNRLVRNYLPSLSAAIGDFELSRHIWKLCIILHTPGRLLIATMYFKYLRKVLFPQYVKWVGLVCFLHIIEIFSLLGLTIITSKQNFSIHATCFSLFLICSILYMLGLCTLMTKCRQTERNKLEDKGLRLKKLFCQVAIICTFLLLYLYRRHQSYCEEGVYTMFAMFEYIVVTCNIGFNGSAYFEFFDRIIVVDFFQPCKVPVYKQSWAY